MGNYKRTVRCSYCHQSGHNKNGCADYKERIEDIRASEGSDHWAVLAYDAKRRKKAETIANRKCTYCGGKGHNRAGCTKLKAAMKAYSIKNAEYRANVLAAMAERGIGIGAMMGHESWDGYVTRMITGFEWEKVNMNYKGQPFIKCINVKHLSRYANPRWHEETRLPRSVTNTSYGPQWDISVPSSESAIRASVPSDFLSGKLGLKQVFKDKDSDLYTMRDYSGDFVCQFDADNYTTDLK